MRRDSNVGVFLWILPNVLEQLFLKNTSGGCFWSAFQGGVFICQLLRIRAYSSTDIWTPPIHVSDWLICCCENLILYQEKKWKWWKHKFYDEKPKKMSKKYMKALCNEVRFRFCLCSKVYRDGENILVPYCQMNTFRNREFYFMCNVYYFILQLGNTETKKS